MKGGLQNVHFMENLAAITQQKTVSLYLGSRFNSRSNTVDHGVFGHDRNLTHQRNKRG